MDKLRKYKEVIYAISAVAALYAAFALLGIGCPIKYLTGISCAGCGMTRAWAAALRLDFAAAASFHPLWWSIPPAALIFITKRHIRKNMLNIFLCLFINAFVIVYLYRMLAGGQDIVVCNPQDGLIWRIIRSAADTIRRGLYVLQ